MINQKIELVHVFSLPLMPFSGSRNYVLNLLPRLSQYSEFNIKLLVEKDDHNYLIPLIDHNILTIEVPSPKYTSWMYFSENRNNIGDLIIVYMDVLNKLIKHHLNKIMLLNIHHVTYLLPYIVKLSKIFGIPNIVTVHGTGIYEIRKDNKSIALFLDDVLLSSQYVDKFIVPSYFMLNLIKNTLKIKKDRIVVIYPGVNLNEYSPTNFSRDIKDKFGDFVLYFGRIEKEKGIDLILKIGEMLPEVPFVICGKGKDAGYLIKTIQDRGLVNVTYLGFVSKDYLRALVATANLTILPAIWEEPFPLAPLESISSGTPVIVSSAGGLPELPKSKGIVILKDNTPEKFAKAIINNLYIKNEVSMQLRKIAMERYSWERVAKEYKEIYHQFM